LVKSDPGDLRGEVDAGQIQRLARAALDLLYVLRFRERFVTDLANRPVLRAAAVGALALALGLTLSACGRKGPLDLPPGAQVFDAPAPNQPEQFDAQGRPIAPPGQKKRLPIDWLLD
jgi:predicted small lipoprotein YifL